MSVSIQSAFTARPTAVVAAAVVVLGSLSVTAAVVPVAEAAQAKPGHTSLVPDVPRNNTPRISNGEIFDIEVVPQLNRVFIAGSFSSIQNRTGNTAVVNQAGLASYNMSTGLIDTAFRPSFNGGVSAVEASPDGTKLFVGGTFSSVSGVARQKVASLNLTTGVPVAAFASTKSTNNAVNALAATNSTLYVGGKFSRINGTLMTGLAALSASTGDVDPGFDNQISGGIGVNGVLTVQQLKLTHDDSKLLVVHSGRKIAGQDRLAAGLIDTQTKQLLPWRTRLWDEYLPIVGGVQRVYAADIAPDDSYFVVGSGSGGDRPPISDTAVAYPLAGADNVQPLWVSRAFDSIYSVAITEQAVYIGGHFNWNESPTATQPWPGLENVGYGNGQGLSGYGLGDEVVHRFQLGALNPVDGTALEWGPISTAFEGNKAMEATPRGLFVGGDGMYQGGLRTGRVAFYDFNSLPAPSTTDTTITAPIEGRVVTSGTPFTITGTAKNPQGIRRVQVQVKDRDTKQFLQDDLTSWGRTNSINATLGSGTTNRSWSLPLTLAGTRLLEARAKTIGTNGVKDTTQAIKKFEIFSFDDQTPSTSITAPSGVQPSTSFTVSGTATDDHGINALTYWFRDENNQYLQNDGTVAPIFNTFRGAPDVIGAPSATWSYDVTLPHEGVWRGSATAIDTAGQADLRSGVRDWVVDSNASPPTVEIAQPVTMIPPIAAASVVVTPGSPLTFSGTATDDQRVKNVEILLRNTSTGENLGSDGSWGVGVAYGYHRISPVNVNMATYNWSYTTPFSLSPGSYQFTIRATDNDDLTTPSSSRGSLTVLAQIPGDSAPNGLLDVTGAQVTASSALLLTGTATDDLGVQSVVLTIRDNDTGRYMQPNGSMSSDYATLSTTLTSPLAMSTSWSRSVTLPTSGNFAVTAFAYDTAGQRDPSTSGATASYRYYPGDAPPTFEAALGQPVDGTAFTEGRIVVTGRATDDLSIAKVEVAVVNPVGQYMSGSGSFTSTNESWRSAFINSPGSTGSNFSYTTPVIADGTYTVLVRATDHHSQISEIRTSTGITVTHPENLPPVAAATVSCAQNVCSFDARSSTDENPTALTYAWNFGNGSGSGPVPVRTYPGPGPYTVSVTVTDEWLASSTFVLAPFTLAEPVGNAAPLAVLTTSCVALTCGASSASSSDANAGDLISRVLNWGDGSTTTSTTSSHTYASPGNYVVTLTVTDGWGKSNVATKTLSLVVPPGNNPPAVGFTTDCTGLTCSFVNTTTEPDGDVVRYAWAFGTIPESTSVSQSPPPKTYPGPGTYTVTLTATDGWNQVSTVSHTVSVS